MEELRRSYEASTINTKKAAIFAIGWWLRKLHGFKKYPDCYKAAKSNVGIKSVVFGVPRWPKKYETGPLQRQMEMFYRLMEQSLHNEEWKINNLAEQLLFRKQTYYHTHVKLELCQELWWDCATDLKQCGVQAYSFDSRALACRVFDEEDFDVGVQILCDSLDDTGHGFESDHLRTGKHTPGCPVLRKIAGIMK
jgi:hypothetical protein